MQRNKLIIALALLAAAAAVWIATHWDGDPERDATYATHWKCAECDYEFELLPIERAQALELDGRPPILCVKCAEKAAYQVLGCPTCGTLYFGAEVPGSTGFCPICHPQRPETASTEITEGVPQRPVTHRN